MEPLALKDHDEESRVFLARVLLVFSLAVFLMILLVVRLFYLQIIKKNFCIVFYLQKKTKP